MWKSFSSNWILFSIFSIQFSLSFFEFSTSAISRLSNVKNRVSSILGIEKMFFFSILPFSSTSFSNSFFYQLLLGQSLYKRMYVICDVKIFLWSKSYSHYYHLKRNEWWRKLFEKMLPNVLGIINDKFVWVFFLFFPFFHRLLLLLSISMYLYIRIYQTHITTKCKASRYYTQSRFDFRLVQ